MKFSLKDWIFERLSPFRNLKFVSFFLAQGTSFIGTWAQETARAWIVLKLSGATGGAAIGGLMFAAAIPNLLFIGISGAVADKIGPRKILLISQLALSLFAFALGMLVLGGEINYTALVIIAVLDGTAVAFDMPAYNLVIPRIVEKRDLQQALAINSVSFHTSRVVGPALAGLALGFFGEASAFFINSASFLGVLTVLFFLKIPGARISEKEFKDTGSLKDVFRYLKTHPVFFRIFIQFLLVMILIFPLIMTSLRVLVKERFNLDAAEFGAVTAMPGLGALLGSLAFLLLKPKNPLKVLVYGISGIVIFLLLAAESFNLNLMQFYLVVFSFCLFLTLSALIVTVQLRVEDRLRGRVSSLIGLAFVAISPMMGVPIGFLSDSFGETRTIWLLAITFAAGSILLSRHHTKKGEATWEKLTENIEPEIHGS